MFHYHRKYTGIPLERAPRGPRPQGYISGYGYRILVIDGERRFAHRKVMEDHIGRRLLPGENVHHKNGRKLDNRLCNLELWTKKQPGGQRVKDHVSWARELLRLYGDMFPE